MRKYHAGPMPAPLAPALREKLGQVEIATIGHFRHRGFVHRSIQALAPPAQTVIGVAVTLAIPGPDSTLLHHALGLLRPGDVLVIDRLGDDRHACFGGGVALAAAKTGAAAAILDGPCTDPDEIRALGFPLWHRGVASITTRLLDLGGSLNLPVACGGVPVQAGDIVMADATGVLVLPADEIEETLAHALERQARSAGRIAQVNDGARLGDLSGASAMVRRDGEA